MTNSPKKQEVNLIFKKVLQQGLGSFPLQIIGIACSMLISIFIARNYGTVGVGYINISRRIVEFLVLISLLGSNFYLIKHISSSISKKVDFNNHLSQLLFFILILSCAFTFLMYIFSDTIADFMQNDKLAIYLVLFSFNLIPMAIIRYLGFAFNGKKQLISSTFFTAILSPLLTLLYIALSYLLNFQIKFLELFYVILISNILSSAIILVSWFYQNPLKSLRVELNIKSILTKTSPFLIVALASYIYTNFDVFIIEYLIGTEKVGLYVIPFRLGMMMMLLHGVTAKAINPTISELLTLNKTKELESLLQKMSRYLTLLSVSVLFFFVFFGKFILSIWGAEFVDSFYVLLIIVMAQCINIVTGYTGLVMMMSGNEKIIGKLILCLIPVSIILNFILIPTFGIFGAAISFLICLSLQNIFQYFFVRIKLKIDCINLNIF